jgi:pilus assembly protein Flp/PilA
MSNMFLAIKLAIETLRATLNNTKSQKGVTMMEYALIAALIAVVAIGTLTTLGSNVNAIFNNISGKLAGAL